MSEADLLTEEERKAEAKRIADRDRKRSERAIRKKKKDEVTALAQARRDAEAQAEDAQRRRNEREAMLLAELTPPIDEISDPEYWLWVLREIDDYLHQFESMTFTKAYEHLSASPAGRAALRYFGVEPMCIAGCIATDTGIIPWSPLPATTDPNVSHQPAVLSPELRDFYNKQMQEKFSKIELEAAEKRRHHRERTKDLERQYLAGRKKMRSALLAKESA